MLQVIGVVLAWLSIGNAYIAIMIGESLFSCIIIAHGTILSSIMTVVSVRCRWIPNVDSKFWRSNTGP